MNQLLGVARFTFHAGAVEEFKRLSAKCIQIVREQDTGTTRYEIYLNADESEAIVIEEYVDSSAFFDHLTHIGPELMAAISATGTLTGEVLGNPSPELREQLEHAPVRTFVPFQSLTTGCE
ncbi:antibiotic biosynthesis monooxygenase [Leifsonia sp. NPDC058292]|uniref:antibiotic biosynthesis monooxygenase n=1 Tax=Leifsonia sp. NPDC058292 TaxID=3346428 RepID=UPI0036DF4481